MEFEGIDESGFATATDAVVEDETDLEITLGAGCTSTEVDTRVGKDSTGVGAETTTGAGTLDADSFDGAVELTGDGEGAGAAGAEIGAVEG